VGLLMILRAGQALVPPPSVGGVWTMHVVSPGAAASPCLGSILESAEPRWTIAQSGTRAELSFTDLPRARVALTIDGDSIVGVTEKTAPAACRTLTISSRLARVGQSDQLSGILREGCEGCGDIAFIAVRQSGPAAP
jgi:hypothetical protein